MAEKNYYELLGVKQDASTDEIKKAFKKLARKNHPDVGGDETKFKEISNAYDVLSDQEKRAEYDDMLRFGAFTGSGGGPGGYSGYGRAGGSPFGGGQPGAGWRTVSGDFDFGNLGDIFAHIRNGEGAFGANWSNAPQSRPGRDLQVSLEVSFEEAFRGTEKRVTIRSANGQEQTLNVKVPAGAVDGGKLRYKGQGDAGESGGGPGDLVIVTVLKKHPLYSRKGPDVLMTLPVSVAEAALGAQVVIPAPDGSLVKLRIPNGSKDGKVLLVKGKGAPRVKGQGSGDLRVTLQLALPAELNAEQKAALEAFAAASAPNGQDIRPQIAAATATVTGAR